MDFIERWLHISPDGGNGASELLIATAVVVTFVSLAVVLCRHFPKGFPEFLKKLGKRENGDRFDN